MTTIPRNQTGITIGILFGLCHALWVAAVGAGVGGLFLDLLHTAHFVSNPYTVAGIGAVTALFGIVGAFVSGYVIGWVFAWIWNTLTSGGS